MADYKTPDVYVEEISTLPPSVAEVSTAIPAFIGYTEKADYDNQDLTGIPTRITGFLEFKTIFGGPLLSKFEVTVHDDNTISVARTAPAEGEHNLYYSLDHYFKNGGGDCYIVSLGTYKIKTAAAFKDAVDALRTEDEPTLIVLSEATTLLQADYIALCQQALEQCSTLKDRFCIIDVIDNKKNTVKKDADEFRNALSSDHLQYGAAYYPYLETSLNYQYREEDVLVSFEDGRIVHSEYTWGKLTFSAPDLESKYKNLVTEEVQAEIKKTTITVADGKISIAYPAGAKYKDILAVWNGLKDMERKNITLSWNGDQNTADEAAVKADLKFQPRLSSISKVQTAAYNAIKQEISKERITLPPAPAVAGIYAAVDRERGVWKAPANVALNAVIAPSAKISSGDQEGLNIDATGGKSINAIRGFLGKGTLVWGARTLMGNDNEWRYINVRRLFSMIEESTKKASYFAVFEPNTASTWLKVKGMVESFLYRLWQQGALAGSTPKAAYFVNIGLGTTMTQQDILEGRMIVEIGIAAVRPAEFIVLRFSHKLQEA